MDSLLRLPRQVRKAIRNEWYHATARLPVRPDVVLYEAFGGRGVLCHPEAIFRELLGAEDLQHLHHVWVLGEDVAVTEHLREIEQHPRVSFVRRGSYAYVRALATSGFLVNNATFPAAFAKREGQVYLNTWHGTPLKRMGHDEPGETAATRNVLRNFLMCDFVLSSSPYMTSTMYESAYRLLNIYPGRIIEEGGPRTDRQVLDRGARSEVRQQLVEAGLDLGTGTERIVLYAPTWRGASFSDAADDALDLLTRTQHLSRLLGAGHRVLLKVHQQVYDLALTHPEAAGQLVPNEIPANAVLAVVDVLVTDFSSILFDALATDLPLVLFAPDLTEYAATRGLYLAEDELPGPLVTDLEAAAERILAVGSGSQLDPQVTHALVYRAAKERFAAKDDGLASKRVVDVVWRGRTQGLSVSPVRSDGRTTVLIYLGGLKSNGITTSALNLLRSIDHSRFDVTAVYRHSGRGDRAINAGRIPPEVRRLARIGRFTTGKAHRRKRRRLLQQGGDMSPQQLQKMLALLNAEWRRCVGSARFDHLVDFSGYSPFWSFLMAEAPTSHRSIWLHNDLKADQMRMVDGARPFEHHLGAVFSSYRFYDNLVSVSEALRDINAEHLAGFAPASKFTFARNTIDAQGILAAAAGHPDAAREWPGDHILEPIPSADEDADELVATPDVLAVQHDVPHLQEEIARRLALGAVPPRSSRTRFVTVGRVSPEKNHARLIRAFAALLARHADAELVIIGDGPLLEGVRGLAESLGVAECVHFTGLLHNPWALMADCDVFVMSSDYEGQPMVILEARVLGLPVVSTAFGSVGGAIPPGSGLVVERSEEALTEGMAAALRGEVPNPPFDAQRYNDEAMAEFYRAIGAT
ncbi:glycosyltransferase [Fodinibacter luteus]|uniref:glycosyltransferase n=1 Tax=Fodinibacter luteus TaxID=552064 RepID=UPI0031E8A689